MSAFVGLFHLDDRPAEQGDLHRMLAPVRHRGIDGSGVWHQASVGLGHCLLQTTPESTCEKQPHGHPSGPWVIAADARLDNREELLASFGLRDAERVPDSELVLHAYARWGDTCPQHLLGDFSFVIWDQREQKLFCARDHFGVRPFYYYHANDVFVFASDLNAVMACPHVPRHLNETHLADILVPMLEDRVGTCYSDVFRLPPAHTATVTRDRMVTKRYWELDVTRELPVASSQEYAEGFRAVFTDAVRSRLRSAYPVGSMLSGGLDSSSIVCTARRILQSPMVYGTEPRIGRTSECGAEAFHTFSAVFDNQAYDEQPFINAVVEQGGSTAHLVPCKDIRPLDGIEFALQHVGEMFLGPNVFLHLTIFREIQQAGIRTAFDGFDGDSTVSHGVAHIAALASSGHLWAAIREARALAQNFQLPAGRTVLTRAIRPAVPGVARRTLRRLRRNGRHPWDAIIHPDFARRVDLHDRVARLNPPASATVQSGRHDHFAKLSGGIFPAILEVMDRLAAAHGIRMLYPFCDVRLMEYCLALPPEQKLHRGWTRVVMRRAMTELPEKVRWRTGKSDYTDFVVQRLLACHRDVIEETIQQRNDALEPYIDLHVVRTCYQRYVQRPSSADAITLWKAIVLSRWLRTVANASIPLTERRV